MKYQRLGLCALVGLLAAGMIAPVAAQVRQGFYGGISLKERGTGVSFGQLATPALVAATSAEPKSRQQVFGGYRWQNDLAVEAAFAKTESYALKPFGAGSPGGVGLMLGNREDSGLRGVWNVDVVGSYTFLRAFALYGRVGYAQTESTARAGATLLVSDVRRNHDGMNYGLGLRYDVNRALGVNLEYTRFGRFAFDSFNSTLPDSDQLRLGVQLRF
ncbi:MAG: outer membrane beta-barrel protein [Burkholderiales bacterium]|jgi:opacity protein-like surface antigen|nr:outer membrane beta-barrel protein [Burkholderiales bacterium]